MSFICIVLQYAMILSCVDTFKMCLGDKGNLIIISWRSLGNRWKRCKTGLRTSLIKWTWWITRTRSSTWLDPLRYWSYRRLVQHSFATTNLARFLGDVPSPELVRFQAWLSQDLWSVPDDIKWRTCILGIGSNALQGIPQWPMCHSPVNDGPAKVWGYSHICSLINHWCSSIVKST